MHTHKGKQYTDWLKKALKLADCGTQKFNYYYNIHTKTQITIKILWYKK